MFDVFLMQGPSGSGKSKYAKMMKDAAVEAGYITSILSADDYFRDDSGNYNFDRRMLNRAHMSVVTRAFRLMNHATDDKNGRYRIIIDNTHMETWEWEAISVIAHELGARRIVLQGADILHPFDEFCVQDHDSLDTMARVLHHRQDKGMDYSVILGQLMKYKQSGGELPDYIEVRIFNTGLK
ncbi:ATP-binding protein [Candidatus Poseidoniales archaeon]|jgi:hypothetical protein|nr:ATP-binding protein [Candidatus Poseidoniales archaeon]